MRQICSLLLLLVTALCFATPATSSTSSTPATPARLVPPARLMPPTTLTTSTTPPAPVTPAAAISKLMAGQAAAWNQGNIEEFMKGYWNNDSLVFIGQAGPTYGYQQALANYKKRYDSPEKMGQLTFTLIKMDQLSADYCFVIGKWALKRKAGDIGGTYTLLFRKIKGSWLIIVDHTS